ncbi:hypothetical protein PCI56_23710 [Plesiomonas shigelloides subsp. oncorhynchi]|nr:hypothetical protein [Plesiomonas shigelloides]
MDFIIDAVVVFVLVFALLGLISHFVNYIRWSFSIKRELKRKGISSSENPTTFKKYLEYYDNNQALKRKRHCWQCLFSESPTTVERQLDGYKTSELTDISFSYIDTKNNFTQRRVSVNSITNTYIKGYCLDRQATRTFKIDSIIGDVVLISTGEEVPVTAWANATKRKL